MIGKFERIFWTIKEKSEGTDSRRMIAMKGSEIWRPGIKEGFLVGSL